LSFRLNYLYAMRIRNNRYLLHNEARPPSISPAGRKAHNVYLIDYGLAKKYMDVTPTPVISNRLFLFINNPEVFSCLAFFLQYLGGKALQGNCTLEPLQYCVNKHEAKQNSSQWEMIKSAFEAPSDPIEVMIVSHHLFA